MEGFTRITHIINMAKIATNSNHGRAKRVTHEKYSGRVLDNQLKTRRA